MSHPTVDFAPQLEMICNKYGLPSLSAAGILNGHTIGVAAVGVRQMDKPEKVTLEDAYQLGSLTKSCTATMIARLVERRILRWTVTLAEALPQIAMRLEYKTVTLEMLLTHRSGITANVAQPIFEIPQHKLAQARNVYLEKALALPRGQQKYLYSNVGYVAAAMIAEVATGKTWQHLVREEVFVPLEMNNADFGFGTINDPAPHIWHKLFWQKTRAIAMPYKMGNSQVFEGADGIRCSLTDLAKYVTAHLQGSSFLSPETWAYLHQDPFGKEYALGWALVTRPWAEGFILSHNGSNTYNYASAWFVPEKGIAMLAATNIGAHGKINLDRSAQATNDAIVVVFQELTKLVNPI
jgi:CubicO group peptidase (beta-lactamase class C family)